MFDPGYDVMFLTQTCHTSFVWFEGEQPELGDPTIRMVGKDKGGVVSTGEEWQRRDGKAKDGVATSQTLF